MSRFDATKLREFRKLRGYSQEEMARRAGIDERTIRRAERGETVPHGETVRIFAKTLGVSLDDFFVPVESPAGEPAPPAAPEIEAPVLAVLPFADWQENASAPGGYFIAGLLEDLVMRLAMHRIFPVISRNSTLAYVGALLPPQEVCKQLGARYLVEGSVRRDAAGVCVSAHLVEGASGQQLWAERYEIKGSEVIALQEEISARIAATVAPTLLRHEMHRISRRPPRDMSAWDAALRGLWHLDRRTPADNRSAHDYFIGARDLDPSFVLPWYGAAMSHYADLFNGWTTTPERSAAGLSEAAREAKAVDPDDPQALLAEGYASMVAGDRERACARLERAIEVNPSAVRPRLLLGNLICHKGEVDRAIRVLEGGMRLSPRDPMAWAFEAGIAVAHIIGERYADGLEWALRAERSGPPDVMVQSMLAVVHIELGDMAAARGHIARVRRQWPEFSLANLEHVLASMDTPHRKRLINALSKLDF
jgi:adenylate cyclase